MKLITWNINGYRAVTGQNPSKRYDKIIKENRLFSYIDKEKPDIVCLQEIKASLDQIDETLKSPIGYQSYYNIATSKKGYSGVAVFTKLNPKKVNDKINIEKFDCEGRILQLDFDSFTLFNIYFPKGYAENERLGYKLDFYKSFFEFVLKVKKKQKNIIISGDYNTAHKEIDLARPKENTGTSGFLPEERILLDELIDMGFVDTFRMFESAGGHYSWWSQRGRARENNIGWRIDYHFVSKEFSGKVKNCYIQPDISGSDHCPVIINADI